MFQTIYFQAKQKWWLHQGLLFTSINTCVFKTLILHRVRTNYTAKHSLEEQRMNSSVHTEADDQNSAVEQTTRTRSSAYTVREAISQLLQVYSLPRVCLINVKKSA